MTDKPVGAPVDHSMTGLDDHRELEEATKRAHRPGPQSESGHKHGQPHRYGPPSGPWQREIPSPPGGECPEADSRKHRQGERDEASIAAPGVAPARAKRERELEHPPAGGAQPEHGS